MSNNKGFISVVVVVLISVLAVGAVGAAWYYEANKEETSSTSKIINTATTNTNTATNTNTVTDETDDWETYENNDQGYQIYIPQDWTIEEVDYDGIGDNFTFPGPVRYTKFYSPNKNYTLSLGVRSKGENYILTQRILFYADSQEGIYQYGDTVTISTNELKTVEYIENGILKGWYLGDYASIGDYGLNDNYVEANEKKIYAELAVSNGDPEGILKVVRAIVSSLRFLTDTSDWETYTNEEYGFSIEYPKIYNAQEDTHTKELLSVLIEYPTGLTSAVQINVSQKTIKELVSELWGGSGTKNIAGALWQSYAYDPKDDSGATDQSKSMRYLFEKGDNTFIIYIPIGISWEGVTAEESDSIAETMLSTFQFLDDTSDWQTYTNEEYSFQYPSNWSIDDGAGVWLVDKDGNRQIHLQERLRNTTYDFQDSLEKDIASHVRTSYMTSVEGQISQEIIVDSSEMLGYLSQWDFAYPDRENIVHTRADFESKTKDFFVSDTGVYATVYFFTAKDNFNDLVLFEQIASTFIFTN